MRFAAAAAPRGPATLAEGVTESSPASGGNLLVSSVAGFDPDGGEAVIEPGTSGEEYVSFDGVDVQGRALLGISRAYEAAAHEAGSQVRPGAGGARSGGPSPS